MYSFLKPYFRRDQWRNLFLILELLKQTNPFGILNPAYFLVTVWNSRILFQRNNWPFIPHFATLGAFTAPFYSVRLLNLNRFGRGGFTPYLGTGHHRLSRYFYYTKLSLLAYHYAGAVTLFLGAFCWLVSHFLWLLVARIDPSWICLVLCLTLNSTIFFRHTFVIQNYNTLGWLFLPSGLFFWHQEFWFLATLVWIATSFTSFTVVIIATLLSFAYAVQLDSVLPIVTLAPAVLKLTLHLVPNLKDGSLIDTITLTSRAIGIGSTQKTRYTRDTLSMPDKYFYWRIIIYFQFAVVFYIVTLNVPMVFIGAIFLWLINSLGFRFADDQTFEILILTIATSMILSIGYYSWPFLASYWILVSPFYFKPDVKRPINTRLIFEKLQSFLGPVEQGKRILIAFDNPQDHYDNLFDNQRFLIDFPMLVATMRHIHLIPDFSSVFEFNFNGAPDFWGRSVEEVKQQMSTWEADYCIIYQPRSTLLENKWTENQFSEVSNLSWFSLKDDYNIPKSWGDYPEWYLLRLAS